MNILQSKWFPDRKFISGGLGGIAAFFLFTALCTLLTVCLDTDTQLAVAASIGAGLYYLVPTSKHDILKRIDAGLAKAAGYVPERELLAAQARSGPVSTNPAVAPAMPASGRPSPTASTPRTLAIVFVLLALAMTLTACKQGGWFG